MTQLETDSIRRLFKLADIAQEMDFVDLKTIDHFNALRETHGLSTLLLLIKEYITKTNQNEQSKT
jgi:hypothetical protein